MPSSRSSSLMQLKPYFDPRPRLHGKLSKRSCQKWSISPILVKITHIWAHRIGDCNPSDVTSPISDTVCDADSNKYHIIGHTLAHLEAYDHTYGVQTEVRSVYLKKGRKQLKELLKNTSIRGCLHVPKHNRRYCNSSWMCKYLGCSL